jgi:voltage-gated potassium channel
MKNFAANWTQHGTVPMAFLSVIYLAIYSVKVALRPEPTIANNLEILNIAIWVIFATDLAIRFIARDSVGEYLKSNWLELLALLLPFIRALRAFRFVIALRALKAVAKGRREQTVLWASILIPFTWFVGAIAILDAESESAVASIGEIDQALWWSLTTITTVGYGDLYPTTLEGRFVAGALMLVGIALFSACAGVFASWILEDAKKDKKK